MKTIGRGVIYFLILILLAVFLVGIEARAADAEPAAKTDDWLVVTLTSRHHQRGYNEHNYGVGIEHGLTEDWRAVMGIYRNSFFRPTGYVGAMYLPVRLANWRAGGAAILASGYERRPVLLPFPMVSYEEEKWGLNIGPILPTVVGLQVKFRLP